MQNTIGNQETHYIHAKKRSNKQDTPYEIQETHYNFEETIIMSKKILQISKKNAFKHPRTSNGETQVG